MVPHSNSKTSPVITEQCNWLMWLKIKINLNRTHSLKNNLIEIISWTQHKRSIHSEDTVNKIFGITSTPHLKWNEHCKDLIRRANSRLFQLWKLSNLNVNEENIGLVYKSWIRFLFLYSDDCWLDHSLALFNKIQNVQNRALQICLRKPKWFQVQNLHEEANMKSVREMQIKLANGYIQRAIKQYCITANLSETTVPAQFLQKQSWPAPLLHLPDAYTID